MFHKKVIYLYPATFWNSILRLFFLCVHVCWYLVLEFEFSNCLTVIYCLFFFVMIDWGFGNLNGSLERFQVELFEKHICGGSQVSIFQYSMVLFWCSDNEGMLLTSLPWLWFGMSNRLRVLCTCDLVLSWFSAERGLFHIILDWVMGGIGLVSLC